MKAGLHLFATIALSLVPLDAEPDEAGVAIAQWRLPVADPDIDGPDTPCPWPFDPLLLHGAPIGMYHCPHCGSMVMAGMSHVDYAGIYPDSLR